MLILFAIFLACVHVCICYAGLERCSRPPRSRLKWMLIVQSHVAKVQSLLLSTCCNSFGSSLHVTAWKDQLALSAESNLHLNWNCSSQVLLQLSLFFLRGHPLTFRGNSFAFFSFFLTLWQAHLPHSDGGFVIGVEFGFMEITCKDAWSKAKL